jgi:hypothetical protein
MASEIMKIGLHLVGYKKQLIRQAKKKTNLDHFCSLFGSNPNILAEILEDLQMQEVEEAQVWAGELNIKHFLMAQAPSSKGILWKSNRRQWLRLTQ